MNIYSLYLCVIIVLIIIYIFTDFSLKEKFVDNQDTIISIYSPQAFFGFGDYIRGLIYLYQSQPKSLIIADYRSHPISKFLHNKLIKNNNYIKPIGPIIKTSNQDSREIDKLIKPCGLYINTMYLDNEIISNIRDKILSTFTMRKLFKKKFTNIMKNNNLIPNKFAVLHIRLEDKYFDGELELPKLPQLYEYIENTIIPEWSLDILVMSNSVKLREQICSKYNFTQYNITPIHTGDNKQISYQDTENTLIEFFTMSKAAKIYQFCELKWQVSGFSKRISEIYSIDLIKI